MWRGRRSDRVFATASMKLSAVARWLLLLLLALTSS